MHSVYIVLKFQIRNRKQNFLKKLRMIGLVEKKKISDFLELCHQRKNQNDTVIFVRNRVKERNWNVFTATSLPVLNILTMLGFAINAPPKDFKNEEINIEIMNFDSFKLIYP